MPAAPTCFENEVERCLLHASSRHQDWVSAAALARDSARQGAGAPHGCPPTALLSLILQRIGSEMVM